MEKNKKSLTIGIAAALFALAADQATKALVVAKAAALSSGVAVFPGDIICADGDGVVVVPKALAAEVAVDGLEQERYERFAKLKIKEGRKVPGVYPPNEETKAEYAAWLKAGEPDG